MRGGWGHLSIIELREGGEGSTGSPFSAVMSAITIRYLPAYREISQWHDKFQRQHVFEEEFDSSVEIGRGGERRRHSWPCAAQISLVSNPAVNLSLHTNFAHSVFLSSLKYGYAFSSFGTRRHAGEKSRGSSGFVCWFTGRTCSHFKDPSKPVESEWSLLGICMSIYCDSYITKSVCHWN